MGDPQKDSFTMENPLKGVPPFHETPMCFSGAYQATSCASSNSFGCVHSNSSALDVLYAGHLREGCAFLLSTCFWVASTSTTKLGLSVSKLLGLAGPESSRQTLVFIESIWRSLEHNQGQLGISVLLLSIGVGWKRTERWLRKAEGVAREYGADRPLNTQDTHTHTHMHWSFSWFVVILFRGFWIVTHSSIVHMSLRGGVAVSWRKQRESSSPRALFTPKIEDGPLKKNYFRQANP